MNREECESKILEKLEEIIAIYHEYNPEGDYLTLDYRNDKEEGRRFHFNNAYFDMDSEFPIRYCTILGSF